MKAFLRRLAALTAKEFRQMARDPSSIAIGIVLPIVLILIFGYGISLDVRNAPVAIVMERDAPMTREVLAGLEASAWISPRRASSMRDAEAMLQRREVDAILRTGSRFEEDLQQGCASMQLILHGVETTTAQLTEQYVTAALARYAQLRLDRSGAAAQGGSAVLQGRVWFNEASDSTWYLVPGLIVIIMTLVGAFLTALVMAREWERGTLESLFVTPAGRAELLLSKIIPYFLLGLNGLGLCLTAAHWLFHVPMRGPLWLLILCSALYLIVALGMGLFLSAVTRSQFLACQVALIVSFLPTMMLSGFLFDLRSIPAIARIIGNVLPATHYMTMLKTLFLAGVNAGIMLKGCAALTAYAVLFMVLAMHFTRKRLD
ncbi:MAG: ABC transporter permease [Desulfovibrio sp.]|jgi:ABC-2 type transport system permease protein